MIRQGCILQDIISTREVHKGRYFGENREDSKSKGNILAPKIVMSMVEKVE